MDGSATVHVLGRVRGLSPSKPAKPSGGNHRRPCAAGGQDMSRRARERQEASDAKHYPERWQDERDGDDEELPDRDDEPEPIHTTH